MGGDSQSQGGDRQNDSSDCGTGGKHLNGNLMVPNGHSRQLVSVIPNVFHSLFINLARYGSQRINRL